MVVGFTWEGLGFRAQFVLLDPQIHPEFAAEPAPEAQQQVGILGSRTPTGSLGKDGRIAA